MKDSNAEQYSIIQYRKACKLIDEGYSVNAICRKLGLANTSVAGIFSVYEKYKAAKEVKLSVNEFADFEPSV